MPWPPSLRNMFKERHADLGLPMDRPADLSDWAQQGVLLLNSALTTEAGTAGQHQNLGWERAVVHALASLCAVQPRLVWVLWGKSAERVHGEVLDRLEGERTEDVCLRSPHPSPLSAYRGFSEAVRSASQRRASGLGRCAHSVVSVVDVGVPNLEGSGRPRGGHVRSVDPAERQCVDRPGVRHVQLVHGVEGVQVPGFHVVVPTCRPRCCPSIAPRYTADLCTGMRSTSCWPSWATSSPS